MQERNLNEALGDLAVPSVLPKKFQRHLQIVLASRWASTCGNVVAHGVTGLAVLNFERVS